MPGLCVSFCCCRCFQAFCRKLFASASAKVSDWAVLSPAPLVLLSCRNSACSSAWCFWMCFIELVVLHFALLPPLFLFLFLSDIANSVASDNKWRGKHGISPRSRLFGSLHVAVNSTVPACDTRAADEWHRMCCDGGKKIIIIFPIPDPAINQYWGWCTPSLYTAWGFKLQPITWRGEIINNKSSLITKWCMTFLKALWMKINWWQYKQKAYIYTKKI